MRNTIILLALGVMGTIAFCPGGDFASAQITLVNTATGGPPTATTFGTHHSLDTANFMVGGSSCYRTPASGTSYLPTQAALDPTSAGNGGASADPGFTIQWWYKPAVATAFGYLWGDRGWSSFRCFQNGVAGTGDVIIRGPLTDCNTTGAVLQNATNPAGWIHLAVTVNTKTNQTTWYVNGKQNNTAVAGITGKGTALVCFGDNTSSGYQGNDDDFRIYNWARTAADIASDYTTSAYGTGPSGSPNVPDLGYYECEVPVKLVAGGSPRPGGTVTLDITASGSANLAYQLGSSLGTGPTPIGNRSLGLSLDDLLQVSVNGYWPGIFSGYSGLVGTNGKATASIHIPAFPLLVGTRIHSAFLILSSSAPSGVKSISNTASFTVSK